MPLPVLGLGSNSADKLEMMQRARILVNVFIGPIVMASSVYHTDPWGLTEQESFVNQVIQVETDDDISAIIEKIVRVEEILDKQKSAEKFGPRNIDIDLLLYDGHIYDHEGFQVPHPRLHLRNFVLVPLKEILPQLVHPQFNQTIDQLLSECSDDAAVEKSIESTV